MAKLIDGFDFNTMRFMSDKVNINTNPNPNQNQSFLMGEAG